MTNTHYNAVTTRPRAADGRPVPRLLAGLLLLCTPGLAQKVQYLPVTPGPAESARARTALESGEVVAMRDADAAQFGGMLNLAMGGGRLCLAAARKTPSGKVRLYAGSTGTIGRAGWAQCEQAFEAWVQSETALGDTPDPNGWMQIQSYTTSNRSLAGNGYSREVDLYRANTTDPKNDYFMAIEKVSATAASGYSLISNANSLYLLAAANYAPLFDYGPQSVSSTGSFTIGGAVPVEGGSAAFTDTWNQTPGIFNNCSTTTLQTTYPAKAQCAQQTASGSATLNIPSVQYDQGAIFQLPKGTTGIAVSASVAAYFSDNPKQSFPQSYFPLVVSGQSPVLTVSPVDIYAAPGASNLSFTITASSYLNWTFTLPAWVGVTGQTTAGQGTQEIPFYLAANAPAGTIGIISVDTNPSFAAPAVGSGPLQVRIHVTGNQPASGILLAGGTAWNSTAPLASAEIWNPAKGTVTQTTTPMTTPRASHTATLLTNGKILIAGGIGPGSTAVNSSELFDPATGSFTPGPLMTSAHASHTATLLNDGTVLIAGGVNESGAVTAVAEIYDPVSNSFTQVSGLTYARKQHTATLLEDGTVLVTGGVLSGFEDNTPCEIYTPVDLAFLPGPVVTTRGAGSAAVRLANGQVLNLGGEYAITAETSAELYTPGTANFSPTTGSLAPMREFSAALLLPDQTAIVVGGIKNLSGNVVPAGLTNIYNPSTGTFSNVSSAKEQRDYPTAVLVKNTSTAYDNQVVVAGGVRANTGTSNGTAIEVYNPVSQTWTTAGAMTTSRTNLTATFY